MIYNSKGPQEVSEGLLDGIIRTQDKRIAELEQQLAEARWLRQELNSYFLGYPCSDEEFAEHEKVRAMSDAEFVKGIQAIGQQTMVQSQRDRERIRELEKRLGYDL